MQDAWHKNVASQKTLQHYKAGLKNLTESDIVDAIENRGESAYTTATGSDDVVEKWARNAAPYIAEAQKFAQEKKVITSDADREFNMLENMRRMMKKKEELSK